MTLWLASGQPNYHVRFQHRGINSTLASLFTPGWIDVWRGRGLGQEGGEDKKVSTLSTTDCPHIHTSLDRSSPFRSLYSLLGSISNIVLTQVSYDTRYMNVLSWLIPLGRPRRIWSWTFRLFWVFLCFHLWVVHCSHRENPNSKRTETRHYIQIIWGIPSTSVFWNKSSKTRFAFNRTFLVAVQCSIPN